MAGYYTVKPFCSPSIDRPVSLIILFVEFSDGYLTKQRLFDGWSLVMRLLQLANAFNSIDTDQLLGLKGFPVSYIRTSVYSNY